MAETYHILNWRELPLKLSATLASGLSEDSRSMRRLRGEKLTRPTILEAAILDQLRVLTWMYLRRHSERKIKAPESILLKMRKEDRGKPVTGFESPEDFEKRRKAIIEGG